MRIYTINTPSPQAIALTHRLAEGRCLNAEELCRGGGVVVAVLEGLARQVDLDIKEEALEVDAGFRQPGRKARVLFAGVGVGDLRSEVLYCDFAGDGNGSGFLHGSDKLPHVSGPIEGV